MNEHCDVMFGDETSGARSDMGLGRHGFTLIEVMVSVLLLILGMLAYFTLQLSAIRINEMNKQYLIAQDLLSQEIESVKTVGYLGLKNSSVLLGNMGYSANLASLPVNYKFSGIDTACNAPFGYCVYKGLQTSKEVKGRAVNYNYTVKLSLNPSYLTYPSLTEGEMQIYWNSWGQLKKTNVTFFVGF